MVLYVISGITKSPISEVIIGAIPFIVILIIFIFVLVLFPSLVTGYK
jgi:TRAP-type C4-dicarboxylate transport system permease large subunit